MRSVRKQINSHCPLRNKRFRFRHRLSPLSSKTSTAHGSPSSVALVLFLLLGCWSAELNCVGD
ncbi:hypothetical protein PR202_ga30173 [Eleusine coracana subsp. coracana]|uniref:Uncharacterized protein n=1 Tax=Eleusine coracana subsp. coracana TaxID=191504 RepID=A0AAV5DPX6_ELECO|nr:hypothetical protein PR202_ga30173 [Eleusine coracana subsp. coracana]